MAVLLQSPYYYVAIIILCLFLFWLCLRFGTTVRKITVYIAALTILALLAYTAIAMLNILMHQP